MSLSMYQASIPAFVQMLNNLGAILDKAEAHAGNRKIDLEVLFNYRLAPDMLPFVRQIQIAADLAKGAAARPKCPRRSGHTRWLSHRIHPSQNAKPGSSCWQLLLITHVAV